MSQVQITVADLLVIWHAHNTQLGFSMLSHHFPKNADSPQIPIVLAAICANAYSLLGTIPFFHLIGDFIYGLVLANVAKVKLLNIYNKTVIFITAGVIRRPLAIVTHGAGSNFY